MWFDSHCHLQLLDDPSAAVERARAAGVESLAAIGIDLSTSEGALALAQRLDLVATAGVHPNDCEGWDDDMRARVAELLDQERVVGVGETGLDFYRDDVAPETQRSAFGDHVTLAKEKDKALVIHTRDSVVEVLDVLEDVRPPARVVFHCWTGDAESLERALALGAYVSFAGNVTYRTAEDLRQRVRAVPADRLLVETDSPFLAPVPHRGRPNEPAYVALVGKCIAEVRGSRVESIAGVTTENALRLFGLAR